MGRSGNECVCLSWEVWEGASDACVQLVAHCDKRFPGKSSLLNISSLSSPSVKWKQEMVENEAH